jgi:hypothetical protein
MHLVGPWLSTTGKKKGPKKFRNAEAAQKARQAEEDWKAFQKKWEVDAEERKRVRGLAAPAMKPKGIPPYRRETVNHPSLNSNEGSATLKERPTYTGDAMIGIGQLHKSNAVPIFSQEDAIDISKMRRG